MKLNTLNIKLKEKKKRLGRGIGSSKGKTSGRGHKGQKSRSGVAIKSFEGGQMPLYRRLPKRGFKSFKKEKLAILNLSNIQKIFEKPGNNLKSVLDLKTLKDRNIVDKKTVQLKILGTGDLKKSIEITANFASKKATEKIEKVGGKLSLIKK